MNIAIDIDDTLTDTFDYLMPYVAEYFGVEEHELKEKNISYSNLPKEWKEQEFDFGREYYDKVIENTPFKNDAAKYVELLHQMGHKIFIITGRTKDFYTNPYATTEKELQNGNIYYDKLICTLDKRQACLNEKIDILIDDVIANCDAVASTGIRCILFTSKANCNVKSSYERMEKWDEVLEIVAKGARHETYRVEYPVARRNVPTIFTALMAEAKPVIERFNLKKNTKETKFSLYENEDLRLVITGVGQINMAMAVAHICSKYEITNDTYVINFGTCAGNENGAYLIQKITERETGRTFYPDLLIRHSFEEATLLSGMTLSANKECNDLYDMEGAAFYQSAAKYVWTDRISLIKIVSDSFEPDKVSKDQIRYLVEQQLDKLESYLNNIHEALQQEKTQKLTLDEDFFGKLSTDLCCSVTMQEQLKHLYRYLSLEGIQIKDVINQDYKAGILPCKTRNEGKKYLDEFKKRYL